MTSSQSLFQSAGPLNVAQVSRPKRGLMIKERETSKMKGPHQSGRRQTKEIKEAVRTYWWAPTFFLLLTEAAEKVCWVGPTKIVQQAQRTSPSLFKKLTSQVIGRHIVKGKGWNDDALRKAAQRESPGGKTTRQGILLKKGSQNYDGGWLAFEKARSGEFSLAHSSLTSPGMLDILRTLHIDNPPLFSEFSKPRSVPKVPLNRTQRTDGIQSDEPPFSSDDNEPSDVPFSAALAHALTGEIPEGHLLQPGMKSIQPRPTLANELDNDFPEEDANDMGSNLSLGDGSSNDDYNGSLVSCSRDSIPSGPFSSKPSCDMRLNLWSLYHTTNPNPTPDPIPNPPTQLGPTPPSAKKCCNVGIPDKAIRLLQRLYSQEQSNCASIQKPPPKKKEAMGQVEGNDEDRQRVAARSANKREEVKLQETRHEPKNERHRKHPGSNLQRVTKANCLIQCKTEYST
ncbi:uncharacterized protein EI90DRAFT_3021816 [Cantharellus anzutake]|uniref:uncharacterized protein n=1 Tax=Cantharellus anzutake TaxID=1750568 RepID=UPI001906F5E6|nr:uncharacterized protein EI90DRAFT_3021816 [Cantharellus anzutake]KAF8315739.1 hypothetical protein EI90DRAFT_3021816 [Cantharellus anzutake]